MNLIPMTLAAQFDTLIGVAIAVISFIGWIMNYSTAKQEQRPKGPGGNAGKGPRPRAAEIQSEIEKFMRDQLGRAEEQKQARNPQPVVPPRPQQVAQQRQQTAPRPQRPKQARQQPQQRPQQQSARPAGPAARTGSGNTPPVGSGVGSTSLGSTIVDHSRMIRERLENEAAAEARRMDSGFKPMPGIGGNVTSAPANESPPAVNVDELISDLRSPGGMRRAMMLQMILQPPLVLQKRRD